MASLEILNPVAQVSVERRSLAPRLPTLDKKRIALYWNGKGGGDTALIRVSQQLESKVEGTKFELIRSAIPGPKEKVEYAKSFDGVIGATGD